MKKLGENKIVLNQPGTVKIILEDQDDLWLAYSLMIAPGDVIAADTTRKINHISAASGAIQSTSRVKVNLEIKITSVDFDKSSLRVRGKVTEANEHVGAGSFHTLELAKNMQFDLKKTLWDAAAIEALREGSDGAVDLAVVLMEQGLANVYLVGKRVTPVCAKNIEGSRTHQSASKTFFENVLHEFVKHVDFNNVRCVVIASPGSIKVEFQRYLLSEAQRLKLKSVEKNKSRIVTVTTSSGNKNSLEEVLHDSTVMKMIKETKAATEIRAFKEFSDMLSSNTDRACYGPKNVETAHELVAIETLFITDDLFRNAEIATRQKYIGLVQSVKKAGGKAFVFSTMHVYADQLAQLTGIAAILRFPLPYLDDMEL